MAGRKRRTGNVEWQDLSSKEKENAEINESSVNKENEQEPKDETSTEYNDNDFAPEKKGAKQDIGYNPLVDKGVDEKKYSTAEYKISGEGNQTDGVPIPEQEFTPPPPSSPEDEPTIQDTQYEDINDDSGSSSSSKSKDDDSGGNLQDLPANEKKEAAKMLADYLLQSYQAYIPKVYRMLGRISDKKINKLEQTGEINFDLFLRKSPTERKTIRQVVNGINWKLDESFGVTEEWVEDVRKPLERILMKKEWGITDEGYIALKVVEHNANCIAVLVSIKQEMSEYLEIAKQLTRQNSTIIIQEREKKLNEEDIKRETETKNQTPEFTQPPVVEQTQEESAVIIQPEKVDEGDIPQ